MESTGEADRKRRHFSTISPTAATAKKQPSAFLSEGKKLDVAVLEFQNQKLSQKLEAQKVEIVALEEKFSRSREKQQPYNNTLLVVKRSWEELVDDLESCFISTKDLVRRGLGVTDQLIGDSEECQNPTDVASSPEDAFLSRLLETGATDSSSSCNTLNERAEDKTTECEKMNNILSNIVSAIDYVWQSKDRLYTAVIKSVPDDALCWQKVSCDLRMEVKNLRRIIRGLHLKHKSLVSELQRHQDTDAKNKAELMYLRGELESTIAELEDSNRKLAILKAHRDATMGAAFPVLNMGNKLVNIEKSRDKKKDLQDMESTLKELMDQSSSRLQKLQDLHKERIDILKQLSSLQNNLKSVKGMCSSQAYVLIKDQLAKAKADVAQYQKLFEKLQGERDNLAWREKEMNLKNEVVDVFHRSSAIVDSRKAEVGLEIQKHIKEKNLIETKLEEASKQQNRKEIITEFKALVSSFPEEMNNMQSQLSKYKEAASDVHSVRADVHSLSNILDRKAKELEKLSIRSAEQDAEMQKLQAVLGDLRESDSELKLVLEMFKREATFSSDVCEARDSELKAWAHVQSLKNALDEHNLELQVKTAIEAEAISQQRLAAAEAEIADLRQKLDASKSHLKEEEQKEEEKNRKENKQELRAREKSSPSDVLKSKHEETDAYLSEIETIGQAYDDMQTQNQQLLQQVTERDDYNIKLVLEGVRARQMGDAMLTEKQSTVRAIQRANAAVEFCETKAARIEDQLKICSDQVQRLAEDWAQSRMTLENSQKRLLDVRKSFQQLTETLEESQSKVHKSRIGLADLQIDLERERFERRRAEEDAEAMRRKAALLRSQTEGSSVEKLRQELGEYKEILKCSICLDRRKEVVITKCCHLFCNPCVQRVLEARNRKCPKCAASFGANDVKPVYI